MRRLIFAGFLIVASLHSVRVALADLAPLEITEEDLSPSTFPYQVKFTNGTVTDNGDGTTSVSNGGGGGITIGGTITGGTDTRVLFNDGGVIGEDAGLTYIKGTDALTVGGPISGGNSTFGDTTVTALIIDTASTGIALDTDGDGAFSIQSLSNGTQEEIRVNLDDTSNTAVWTTSTGVTSWVFTSMSLEATGSAPSFKLTPTSGDAHEWWVNGGIAGFANTTDGSQIWRTTTANAFQTIGKLITEGGAELNGVVTAIAATSVTLPRPLTIGTASYVFPPAVGGSGQFLTDDGSGNLTWTTSSGSGDITSVGDVASGAAFDGTQGTVLTFNNAGGDGTLTYGGSSFVFTHTLDIQSTIPVVKWTPSSGDSYESYVASNIWYLTNVTDGLVIARTTQANEFQTVGKLITEGGARLNGAIDATAATLVAIRDTKDATFAFPDLLQAEQDNWALFEVEASKYPFGIRITKVKVSCDETTTLTHNLEEWTSPTDGSPTTITSMPLVASAENTFIIFNDSDIAAGSYVMVDLDTTNVSWTKYYVEFDVKTS